MEEFSDPRTNHTRYPVCDEDIDNVVGVVNTRDFYRFLLDGGQKKGTLRSILRSPILCLRQHEGG